MKVTPPNNRLIGSMPKVGIRPTIDGRLQGVRESLEDQTMNMAKNVATFLTENLQHAWKITAPQGWMHSAIGLTISHSSGSLASLLPLGLTILSSPVGWRIILTLC